MPIGPNGERLPYPGEPGYTGGEEVNPETGLPFTQEELASLLGTYGEQLELGSLEGQRAQADALRGAQVPEGRSSGRVYTAANPLEVLGTIGQQYAGKRMNDRIERKGGKLRGKIGENVRQYGLGSLGVKRAPAAPKVPTILEDDKGLYGL
jgi:hypothetical protein